MPPSEALSVPVPGSLVLAVILAAVQPPTHLFHVMPNNVGVLASRGNGGRALTSAAVRVEQR